MTHNKIEARSRAQIAKFLPDALEAALQNHQDFLNDGTVPTDAAEYKKYQEACKVALAHIELLTKLAAWADIIDPAAEDARKQSALSHDLARAMQEIENYNNIKQDEKD